MTVSFRAVGTWQAGLTADTAITIPAAQDTGDIVLVLAAWKDFSITAQISGYTEITQFTDGAVATGNGTGSMKVGAWYKVATSATEANPTLDFSTTTNLLACATCIVFSQTAGSWATPLFATQTWPSQSTGTRNAISTLVIPPAGTVVCLIGIADDTATFTRNVNGIDQSGAGAIFSGYVEAPATHASTTTGNDMAADAGYNPYTGALSSPSRLNANIISLSAVETGAILWVVLADTAPAGNVTVTPTTKALTVTRNAPTVTASNHQRVTPTTKALASATFAPTVRTPITATPAAVSLAATKYAPTVTASAHQRVTPTTATLTATKYAPAVSTPVRVTPTTKALTLTKHAPTVTAFQGMTVTPTTKALGLSPNAPLVTTSNNQRVIPTTKALSLAAFVPAVASSNHQRVTPTTGALTATRYAPTVTASAHQRVTPTTKALLLTRYAPSVGQPVQVQPTTRALVLATFAPTISTTANARIVPVTLAVTLTLLPPTAVTTAHQLLIVQFASLTVAGFAPSVETHSGTALPDPIYGWGSVIGGGVALPEVDGGPGALVGSAQGGATVTASEGGSTAVSTSGPSARVTIR